MPDPNEPHSVFADPRGYPEGPYAPGSAGPGPRTPEAWINEAINDIKRNIFEEIDDQTYCRICGPPPNGYRLRAGASIEWHANQRQPRTHFFNLVWATCEWFRKQNMPIPKWPECYRRSKLGKGSDRHDRLFCHICRESVGLYNIETGQKHDDFHERLEQTIMRPNRAGTEDPGQINIRPRSPQAPGRSAAPRKRHILDDILTAQREGAEVFIRDPASYEQPEAWKQRYNPDKFKDKPTAQQFDPVDMPNLVPGPSEVRRFTHVREGGKLQDTEYLKELVVVVGDEKWSRACAEQELCDIDPSALWKCPGPSIGCQHRCHEVDGVMPTAPDPTGPSSPEQTVDQP